MAEKAVVQFTMDADLKEQAEALYQRMGMDFGEAVRIFAAQSLMEGGLPFQPSTRQAQKRPLSDLAGIFRGYVTPELRAKEDEALKKAFERAAIEKYEAVNNDSD